MKSVLSYSVSYLLKSAVLIMPGKGKRVNSTAKTITFNVYSYFKRQSQNSKGIEGIGTPKLTNRTADATGYSKQYKVERKKIIVK